MAGICTSHTQPHTQLKKSGISHTHIHTQSMRGFLSKRGHVQTIPTRTCLFAISSCTHCRNAFLL